MRFFHRKKDKGKQQLLPPKPPPPIPLCKICMYSEKDDRGEAYYCVAKGEPINRVILHCLDYEYINTPKATTYSQFSCPVCHSHNIRITSGKRLVCGDCGKIFS